jgi:hypothetical protein
LVYKKKIATHLVHLCPIYIFSLPKKSELVPFLDLSSIVILLLSPCVILFQNCVQWPWPSFEMANNPSDWNLWQSCHSETLDKVKRNLNKKNPWVVPFQMWIYWPSPLSILPLHSNVVKQMMHLHLCWTTTVFPEPI